MACMLRFLTVESPCCAPSCIANLATALTSSHYPSPFPPPLSLQFPGLIQPFSRLPALSLSNLLLNFDVEESRMYTNDPVKALLGSVPLDVSQEGRGEGVEVEWASGHAWMVTAHLQLPVPSRNQASSLALSERVTYCMVQSFVHLQLQMLLALCYTAWSHLHYLPPI